MVQFIIFMLGSFGILIFSRRSLINPRSHGFPRFFAFEAILGLLVLNVPAWLVRPFSAPQIISWVVLAVSAYLAVHTFWVFHKFGQPDRSIQDDTRYAMEKTTHLVTQGPYHLIRHPMYASLLYLAWAVFLKQITFLSGLLLIVATLALYLTAILEERENLRNFGQEYATYMHSTRRFIPYIL